MALAFFDLDNTLVAGDTAQAFAEYIAASDLPTPNDFLTVNLAYMAEYDAGTLNLEDYMRYTLSPLFILDAEQRATLIHQFIQDVVKTMSLPKAFDLLAQHQQDGDELIIISATGSHLVAPIAAYLGVKHSLGVDLEYQDGRITGALVGTPTFREGKVIRAEQWAKDNGHTMDNIYFYSDSHNDLPLLEKAHFPIAVDPDPTLEKIATERGWKVISLR